MAQTRNIHLNDLRTGGAKAAESSVAVMPSKTLDMLNSFLSRYADMGADNMGLSGMTAREGAGKVHETVVYDCDICDCRIVDEMYLCLQCINWDCCSACNAHASKLHPGHDLIRIDRPGILPKAMNKGIRHDGVVCDQCDEDIVGPRFKCISCPDYDLCRLCESHPLRDHKHHLFLKLDVPIKIKTHHLSQAKAAATTAAATRVESENPVDSASALDTKPIVEVEKQCDLDIAASNMSIADTKLDTSSVSTLGTAPSSSRPTQAVQDDEVELNAKVVRDVSFPDYSKVLAGSSFDKIWLVKNTGSQTWPANVELRLISQLGGKLFDNALICSLDGRHARPGSDVLIRVPNIKAPSTPGRVRCFFKLSTPAGRSPAFFGDQLWIDVQVVQDESVDETQVSASSVLLAPSAPLSAPPTDAGSEFSSATSGHARRLAEWKSTNGLVHRPPSEADSLANPPTASTTGSLFDDGSELAWDSEVDDDYEYISSMQ